MASPLTRCLLAQLHPAHTHSHTPHLVTPPVCSIEPADSSFNLVDPSKYNSSFGGLARLASYVAAARAEAAAAGQDIMVLHAGKRHWAVPALTLKRR